MKRSAKQEARAARNAESSRQAQIRAAAYYAEQERIQPEQLLATEQANSAAALYWRETVFIGTPPSDRAKTTIVDHSLAGESPWFLVGSGAGGVLAAFDDRLMIVKTGLLTSFMAGALGGARITTFPFTEITGIEFNAQILTGVLEVLTPSYQGSSNKDYWRGTNQSRNANSDDPWTLSNTLPLDKMTYNAALPHLNRVRAMVAESKKPTATVIHASAESSLSLADELTKLVSLHTSGLLTAEEFAAAKQTVIRRHS